MQVRQIGKGLPENPGADVCIGVTERNEVWSGSLFSIHLFSGFNQKRLTDCERIRRKQLVYENNILCGNLKCRGDAVNTVTGLYNVGLHRDIPARKAFFICMIGNNRIDESAKKDLQKVDIAGKMR